MSTVYVYSTLSAPVRYSFYEKGGNDIPREKRGILIHGGANVAGKNLVTPRGVVTEITDEEYALLKTNRLFQIHSDNGFVTVEEKKVDVEKIVPDMEPRDQSSPLVEGDFQAENRPEPVVNVQAKAAPKKASPGRPSKKPGAHPASKK